MAGIRKCPLCDGMLINEDDNLNGSIFKFICCRCGYKTYSKPFAPNDLNIPDSTSNYFY